MMPIYPNLRAMMHYYIPSLPISDVDKYENVQCLYNHFFNEIRMLYHPSTDSQLDLFQSIIDKVKRSDGFVDAKTKLKDMAIPYKPQLLRRLSLQEASKGEVDGLLSQKNKDDILRVQQLWAKRRLALLRQGNYYQFGSKAVVEEGLLERLRERFNCWWQTVRFVVLRFTTSKEIFKVIFTIVSLIILVSVAWLPN